MSPPLAVKRFSPLKADCFGGQNPVECGAMSRRQIANFLVLALLGSTLGCTMWEKAPKGWAGATGGEQLERLFWEEIKTKDWKELENHIASTFTAITPSGQRSREQFLEELKHTDLADYSLGDFHVQLNGSEFVVSYTLNARGTRAGRRLPNGPTHAMSVWQQVKKGWILIAHAQTLASQETAGAK